MPASKEKQGRLLADERLFAQTGEFFSRHAVKLVFGATAVIAVVIVVAVSSHVRQASDREKGDWLEKHFFQAVAAADADGGRTLSVDVDAVVAQADGYSGRPYVLYKLARWLFQEGGEQNLRQAARVANLLRDEYEDSVEYQTWSQELLRKIEEERSFTLPPPGLLGPVAASPVQEEGPVAIEEPAAPDQSVPDENVPDGSAPDENTPGESAVPPDGEAPDSAAADGETAPSP